MYLLVVFLPVIGAFVSGFFGRYLGSRGSMLVSTTCVGITALISCFIFYEVGLSQSVCSVKIGPWIDSGMFYVSWGFLFDSLTAVMLIVVTVISFFVHLYSMGYMEHDPHLSRFFSYLSLFTFFMLMLITADNLVQTFLGWEGVGLASYLLINFWFTRLQANKAALKAIIVNRVGDFGLGLAILTSFWIFKSVDFSVMFSTVHFFIDEKFYILGYGVNKITLLCLLLFLGAVGKSAQVGLHTWLPDAMEGPTPVSALIHAATMVTAGVFVILRCSPLLEYSPTALTVITIMGAFTAFFAATTGMLQNDLKRVIAYSTCSQLGYMVFACGISSYAVSLFHLMNHAFFKALLFLSAGAVIHAVADEQDMRKMGGLAKVIPFTYVMMLIGSLSLMGFPFLTGFYSKDVILEMAYTKSLYTIDGNFAYWLGTISAFFTAFYSFRLIYLTFLSDSNTYRKYIQNAHDAPLVMAIPLMSLCFGSIFVGYLMKDMIIGLGTSFWNNALFTLPENVLVLEAEFLPASIKMIPVMFSFIGAGLALILNAFFQELVTMFTTYKLYIYLYKNKHNVTLLKIFNINLFNFNKIIDFKHNNVILAEFIPINIPNLYKFLNKKWYFDVVYNKSIVKLILSFGYHVSFKYIDRGLIEVVGPLGITRTMQSRIKSLHNFQTGYIDQYIFVMISALTLILFPIVFLDQNIITSFIKFFDLESFFNYCIGNSIVLFQSKYIMIDSIFVWIWRIQVIIYLVFLLILTLLFEDFLKVSKYEDTKSNIYSYINRIFTRLSLLLRK